MARLVFAAFPIDAVSCIPKSPDNLFQVACRIFLKVPRRTTPKANLKENHLRRPWNVFHGHGRKCYFGEAQNLYPSHHAARVRINTQPAHVLRKAALTSRSKPINAGAESVKLSPTDR
jgi:hypothetical protein